MRAFCRAAIFRSVARVIDDRYFGVFFTAPGRIEPASRAAATRDERPPGDTVRTLTITPSPRATFDSTDAADALAIAITHAHSRTWRHIETRISSERALP